MQQPEGLRPIRGRGMAKEVPVRGPECAFAIPAEDSFLSALTCAPVPDPAQRSFSLHRKSGYSRAKPLRRSARTGISLQGLVIAASDPRSFGEFVRTAP